MIPAAPLTFNLPVSPVTKGAGACRYAKKSELPAGEIVGRFHLAELRDRFNSEPSALNSSKFGPAPVPLEALRKFRLAKTRRAPLEIEFGLLGIMPTVLALARPIASW